MSTSAQSVLCRSASAFVLPGADGCLLLPLVGASSLRVAVDGATVGRADEEGIGPWIRTARSPEALTRLSKFIAEGDSTHRCSLRREVEDATGAHGCPAEVSTFSTTIMTWRLR
jgi:hypothetical protein